MALIKILIFCSMISQASAKVEQSARKPVCNSKVVTRNCDFFKERADQYLITLSDGSTISNPMYDPSKNNRNHAEDIDYKVPFGAIDYDKILFDQSEIIDALVDVPASTRFKMTFANYAATLVQNPDQNIEIPWPPADKNAKRQFIKRTELMAYLKEEMSTADYIRLQTLMQKQSAPLQAKMQKLANSQQRAIVQERKRFEQTNLMQEKRNKKKNRIRDLFLMAREDAEAMIRRGKKDNQLNPQEKILINKVRTIELTDIDDPDVSSSTSCAGGIPNAFYTPVSHTLNICPGQVFKSDADMMLVIAHEIGHAIDPCHSMMGLWKVNEEKIKQLLSDSNLSADVKPMLKDLIEKKVKILNFEPDLLINDLDFSKKLVQSGALKKVEQGIQKENYPFAKEYDCLVHQGFFRENTTEDIATFKKYYETHLKQQTNQGKIYKKTLDRYNTALDKYPQCLKTLAPSSEMTETIGDMVGAVIAEKYILENPFKNEEEKVAAMSFASSACNLDNSPPPESYAPTKVKIQLSSHADPHPGDAERVEKIMLNLPGMAQIYDCRRKVPACFDHLSFFKRMASTMNSKDADNKKQQGTK